MIVHPRRFFLGIGEHPPPGIDHCNTRSHDTALFPAELLHFVNPPSLQQRTGSQSEQPRPPQQFHLRLTDIKLLK